MGSIGGNIGNGSPKADSALIFMATNSMLRLVSADSERILPIRKFYLGRKKLDLAPDELIVEVLMPIHGIDNYYYKKVGGRRALAISRVAFAGIMDVRDGIICNCAAAFGSIGDVIVCLDEIDRMLVGKSVEEASALKEAYIDAYNMAIVPVAGRVSADYRKQVCMNLLRDFLESNHI
jgi:xanthine dehydrogenase iron-sulfur cluster and FAD-binding subunit A